MLDLKVHRWSPERGEAQVPCAHEDFSQTNQELLCVGGVGIVAVASVVAEEMEDVGDGHGC